MGTADFALEPALDRAHKQGLVHRDLKPANIMLVRAEATGPDGRIGFRVGKAVNLLISTLNVTRRLAPVPVKKGMAAPLPTSEVQPEGRLQHR